MTTEQRNIDALGRLLAARRETAGLSLRELEKRLGVSRAWLHELEQGRMRNMDSVRLFELTDLLGIEPAEIEKIMGREIFDGLPSGRTYFRAKYDLSREDAAKVEAYVRKLQNRRKHQAEHPDINGGS